MQFKDTLPLPVEALLEPHALHKHSQEFGIAITALPLIIDQFLDLAFCKYPTSRRFLPMHRQGHLISVNFSKPPPSLHLGKPGLKHPTYAEMAFQVDCS